MEFKLNIENKTESYHLLLMKRKTSLSSKLLNLENFSSKNKIVLNDFSFQLIDNLLDEINIRLEEYDVIEKIIINCEDKYKKLAERLQYELIDFTEIEVIVNYL